MHDLDRLAAIFAALASPTRLRIVALLADARDQGRAAASAPGVLEIADGAEISRFSASFHLEQLRDAGIVRKVRVGTRWAHSLTEEATDAVDEWLFDVADDRTLSGIPS